MADTPLGPDSVRANTSAPVDDIRRDTTRRTALATFAVPALAMLSTNAAARLGATPVADGRATPSPWQIARDAYLKAKQAEDDFDRAVWLPAQQQAAAAVALIPHQSIDFVASDGSIQQMTTEVERDVWGAQGMLRACGDHDSDYMTACRKLVAAHDARTKAVERIMLAPEMAAADQHVDDLREKAFVALKQAIACPVRTAAELVEKMTLMAEQDEFEVTTSQEALLADARRLAGEARPWFASSAD